MPRAASPSVLVLAISTAITACGDGGATPLDGAAPLDGAPIIDTAAPPVCPLFGAYALRSIACLDGQTRLDLAAFVSHAPDSVLVFAEVGGTCQVQVGFEGPACLEEQPWTMARVPDDPQQRWTLTGTGIARCAPAGCRFGPDDDACLPGARAGTATASVAIVLDAGDLVLGLDGAAGACAARGFPQEEQVWHPVFDPGV